MFIQLYRNYGGPTNPNGPYQQAIPYLEGSPYEISLLIDQIWNLRLNANPSTISSNLSPGTPNPITGLNLPFINQPPSGTNNFVPWHLIYAYMIENTRIFEIFEKVLINFLNSEKLGFPQTMGTNRWLRLAEELLYKNSSNFLIQSMVSNIRPDVRSSRRNAYYRMFGMDLNHGTGNNAQYPYQRPQEANKDFVPLFEELLSEVWIGITNSSNQVGANPTDDSKMDDLIRRLKEILSTRRQYGNLEREEFVFVATMSWLHLTLLVDDAPIIKDLGISAQSPAERLKQMGSRVGYPSHPKADAFFEMAEPLSTILTCIEQVQDLNCQQLYIPVSDGGLLRKESEKVISQWSIATGRDLKSLKVRSGGNK